MSGPGGEVLRSRSHMPPSQAESDGESCVRLAVQQPCKECIRPNCWKAARWPVSPLRLPCLRLSALTGPP